MNQIKFNYGSPFNDSHSHPIYTCFPIIGSKMAPIGSYDGKKKQKLTQSHLLETTQGNISRD